MTDEDAFAIMGELGGVGIIVSETARETAARYGLRNPHEVVQFLEHFIERDVDSTEVEPPPTPGVVRPLSRAASLSAAGSTAGSTG